VINNWVFGKHFSVVIHIYFIINSFSIYSQVSFLSQSGGHDAKEHVHRAAKVCCKIFAWREARRKWNFRTKYSFPSTALQHPHAAEPRETWKRPPKYFPRTWPTESVSLGEAVNEADPEAHPAPFDFFACFVVIVSVCVFLLLRLL